jgi:Rrf2 family protein
MLKLSKRVEYGLMALRHLAERSRVSTAREIADSHSIPYDLLAKVMQSLKRDGIIDSYQGVKGGYALMLSPSSIPLMRVIRAIDDDPTVTDCTHTNADASCCTMFETCTIKTPMNKLQQTVENALGNVTVAELL